MAEAETENTVVVAERVMGAFVKLTYEFCMLYNWTLLPGEPDDEERARVGAHVKETLLWATSMPGAASFDIDGNKVR